MGDSSLPVLALMILACAGGLALVSYFVGVGLGTRKIAEQLEELNKSVAILIKAD